MFCSCFAICKTIAVHLKYCTRSCTWQHVHQKRRFLCHCFTGWENYVRRGHDEPNTANKQTKTQSHTTVTYTRNKIHSKSLTARCEAVALKITALFPPHNCFADTKKICKTNSKTTKLRLISAHFTVLKEIGRSHKSKWPYIWWVNIIQT